MDKVPVIINRSGGTAAASGESLHASLELAFTNNGFDASIELVDGSELQQAFAQFADAKMAEVKLIVVGGGDGTAASAAAALANTPTNMALLPLGTLNHLARDLSIPADLNEAVKLALEGKAKAIDLGNVNGHRFVNNASIGLYPSMVTRREEIRSQHKFPKWFASIFAAASALWHLPQHRLELDTGDGPQRLRTPLLFVGNNVYSLEAGEVGTRPSLSDGHFSVFAIKPRGRLALLWFGLRAIFGHANLSNDFIALGVYSQFTITSQRRSIDVGLDGEVCRLDLPLYFKIEPAALRVICPDS
jgi:diacylglycerol kinase family enzyme